MRARKRAKSANVLGFFGEQFKCVVESPPLSNSRMHNVSKIHNKLRGMMKNPRISPHPARITAVLPDQTYNLEWDAWNEYAEAYGALRANNVKQIKIRRVCWLW